MAGFLGALEYVLEEGPRNDWFGDQSVLLLAWVSGISAVIFFVRDRRFDTGALRERSRTDAKQNARR